MAKEHKDSEEPEHVSYFENPATASALLDSIF